MIWVISEGSSWSPFVWPWDAGGVASGESKPDRVPSRGQGTRSIEAAGSGESPGEQ